MDVMRRRPTLEDVDLESADDWDDPYPCLARIRDQGPLVWSDAWQMWISADHAVCDSLLRNPAMQRRYQDREPRDEWESFNRLNALAALDRSGSDHTRLRRALSPTMRKTKEAEASSVIEAEVHALLDGLSEGGSETIDLAATFMEPLPVNVICSVLGLPADSRAELRAASVMMVAAFEKAQSPEQAHESQQGARNLETYFDATSTGTPGDEGQRPLGELWDQVPTAMSHDEAVANAVLLFNGGTGAVINALGTGVVSALRMPDVRDLLVGADRGVVTSAVEEMLRHDAPLQLFEREALEDVSLGDVRIGKGDRVGLLLGGANRDPKVFSRPDEFDVLRDPNPHVTFSAGPHFCLGAPLARLQMRIAVTALFARFPSMRLAGDPVRIPGFVVRGYSEIPVRLHG